jgi:hypothetical protein
MVAAELALEERIEETPLGVGLRMRQANDRPCTASVSVPDPVDTRIVAFSSMFGLIRAVLRRAGRHA